MVIHIKLLILISYYPLEIYKENPSRRRECLYYLALGEYKLANYRVNL